jgi:hypothetical protein
MLSSDASSGAATAIPISSEIVADRISFDAIFMVFHRSLC